MEQYTEYQEIEIIDEGIEAEEIGPEMMCCWGAYGIFLD